MRLRAPVLALSVLVLSGLGFLLLTGEGPRVPSAPRAPSAGDDQRDRTSLPTPFSPGNLPIPVPRETLATPGDASAPAPGEDPLAGLGRVALARVGALLRELGDVNAYLDGKPAGPGEMAEVPPGVIEAALRALAGPDVNLALQAALALSAAALTPDQIAGIRERFDVQLQTLSAGRQKDLLLALAYALHAHGDPHGVKGLAEALRTGAKSEVRDFRSGAALVLALADDPESAPLLRDLLGADPDRMVRKNAAVGLGRLGGEENRGALSEALVREGDVEVRAWTALAAGRAAPPGGGDEALRTALASDPAGEVRGAAAFALSRAGDDDTEAALESAFYGDDHPFTRIGAVAGIARRDEDGSSAEFLAGQGVPALADIAATSPDSGARYYAVVALGMAPPSETRAATLRRSAADDPSPWVRIEALSRLAAAEGDAARDFLDARAAAEPNDFVKRHISALQGGLTAR